MFTQGLTYQKTITMITEQCCTCGVAFGIPSDLQEQFKKDPEMWFYCPNGHKQHYSKSTEAKLREEIARKEAEIARLAQEKITALGEAAKAARKVKRIEKRINNGVCPKCNRSFTDLRRHMESKHPDCKDH